MKSFTTLALAFLAATISAAPSPRAIQTTTVEFFNDNTGANENVLVNLNVGAVSVASLLAGGPLDKNGQFLSTSFQLQSNFQGITCDLNVDGSIITVNDQKTFARLGYPPVDLVDATIYCHPVA